VVSSNFPNRPFRLEESSWEIGREPWNNRTLWRSELWIHKNSYSPSYNLNQQSSFEHWVNGSKVGASTFAYDFRNADSMILSRYDFWIGHNADGTSGGFGVQGYANVATLGYTSVGATYYPARIPKPPAPPIPRTPDQATATSLRFQFNANGDNGGGDSGWEAPYRPHPTFATNAPVIASDGTSILPGPPPGTPYYFRARGINPYGTGAWSSVVSGKTLTAFYYIDPATNVAEPVTLYAFNGTGYELVDLMLDPELDGTYVPAG